MGNKAVIGIGAFGLCLLVLNAGVWIGVFNLIVQRPSEADVFTPITPVAQKTGPPNGNPAEEDESAIRADPVTADRAIFGMSVTRYAEIQVEFLERLEASPSKIDHWEDVADGRG